MSDAAFALALSAALGFSGSDATVIARAAAKACPDAACVADALVYAAHESSMRLVPKPESWDSKAGLSHGPWQTRQVGLDLDGQARAWVWLRAASLADCGDMTEVASGHCGVARGLVERRRVEASWVGQLVAAGLR